MKTLINNLKDNYSENKNFDVYISNIEKFLNCHPIILKIIESIEDETIIMIEDNRRYHNLKNQESLKKEILRRGEKSEQSLIKYYSSLEYSIRDVYEYLVSNFGKLISSVSAYLQTTDTLISCECDRSNKGIKILAVVNRDGKEYNFDTDCIYAGGHNIQVRHLRYIVKTKLLKIKNCITDNSIIKKMKQNVSTRLQIIPIQYSVSRLQARLDAGNKWYSLSDKTTVEARQLLQMYYYGIVYESYEETGVTRHSEKSFRYTEKVLRKDIKKYEEKINKLKARL